MKPIIASFVLPLIFACGCFAQSIQLPKDTTVYLKTASPIPNIVDKQFYENYAVRKPGLPGKLNKNVVICKTYPLYLYKKEGDKLFREADPASFDVMNTWQLSSSDYIKPNVAIKRYGKKAKNGAVLLTYNKWIEFLNEPDFFERYKITGENTALEMFVDSAIVYRLHTWLYNTNYIRKVSIEVEKETGVKYISILTSKSIPVTHTVNIR